MLERSTAPALKCLVRAGAGVHALWCSRRHQRGFLHDAGLGSVLDRLNALDVLDVFCPWAISVQAVSVLPS